MPSALKVDQLGGANFGNYHLRNVASLHVGGSALATAILDISGSKTAGAGSAIGQNNTTTLVAAANNDVLTAIRIAPTFTNGAFTGVVNKGLWVVSGLTDLDGDLEVAGTLDVAGASTFDSDVTITAGLNLSPPVAAPPMVLNANAQGQKVVGLNADLLDGNDSAFYATAAGLTAEETARVNGDTANSDALATHKTSGDHDGRYFTETELINGQLDTRYYTEAEVNALIEDRRARRSHYHLPAALSIPHGTYTLIPLNNVYHDADSLVTTGAAWHATAPFTGMCEMKALMVFKSQTGWQDGETMTLQAYLNGAGHRVLDYHSISTDAGVAVAVRLVGTTEFPVVAGDTVDFRIWHFAGGAMDLDSGSVCWGIVNFWKT